MNQICEEKQCTGCGLCVVRCPKKCISMENRLLGHVYPIINQDACIDCGLCKKVCPSLHESENRYPLSAYAAWAKDCEDYKTSTSGGAASVITNYILSNGGVVYGCTVFPKVNISHIRIDNIKDAYKLKGSKYVQSNIINILPQVAQDVKTGKKILFTGTPCQVAAVKRMFKTIPDNLYLVDLICHGVPSNRWLIDYIKKNLNIDINAITTIKFRTLTAYQMCIYGKKGLLYTSKSLWQHRYENLYMNTFIDGFTNRESCYNCPYARPERVSDITIGDFWGLGRDIDDSYIPEHKYGISCMMPITVKGQELVEAVKDKMNVFERPVKEAINGNDQLNHPKNKDWRIHMFRILCKFTSISFSYNLLMSDKILKYKIKKSFK